MIHKVIAIPRRQVEHWLDKKESPGEYTWALISIYGDGPELMSFQNIEILKTLGCPKVLSSRFHDITDENKWKMEKVYRNLTLFDDVKARLIINFLDEIKDEVDVLFVHCAAGVSRSGAVGLFATRYLGLDEIEFRKWSPHILPNFFVLSLLNKESGIHDGYVEYWQSELNKQKREKLDNIFGP